MNEKRRKILDNQSLLACEKGSFKKKWKSKLPIALIFPNSYHLGMSNLGYQLIWGMLNDHPDIVCERFFYEKGKEPLSIESNRSLNDFPIVLLSVSFEQDFLGALKILMLSGIEPVAAKRRQDAPEIRPGSPLVVGGGVATFINPEPLSPFVDLFILGELEPVYADFVQYLFEFSAGNDCGSILQQMAVSLPGAYAPHLYSIRYNKDNTIESVDTADGFPSKIKKNISYGQSISGHSRVLSSETEFADIHLVELGRGCSKSCRFCAAGYVYRPPRIWSAQAIIEAVQARPSDSKKTGLLGMEMANSSDLQTIAEFLIKEQCSLSFSSLRADIIKGPLLDLLCSSNLKTAAIAPDGGSERLRKVINKGITGQDCLDAAASLAEAGLRNLKLYFMIGLPTENDDDLLELVDLVKEIQLRLLEVGRQRKFFCKLTLSINSFVPKAWTPFQYCGFTPVKELKRKIKFLRKKFASFNNLKLSFDHPEHAYMQAMLSRGDRRVADVLLKICSTPKNWRQVCKENSLDPDFYAVRPRSENEIFPWDIVDHGISKSYLWTEFQLALKNKSSKGCEINSDKTCKKCGVCNV